jgi:hypothetical protein
VSRSEFVHRLLHHGGEGVEPRVLRLARLEEHVRVLRGAADHRMHGRQRARAQGGDAFVRQQRVQDVVGDEVDLGDLVRGAETVEEVQHRHPPGERGRGGDGGEVVRLLH